MGLLCVSYLNLYMENSFQTSFIPKKPITSSNTSVSGKEPINFFSLIITLILIISILASGGLYFYKLYLNKQKDSLSSSLSLSRDSFEKDTIEELELFNRRTEAANKILSSHIVLSPLFSLLGEITIPQVQYTRFEEQIDDKGVIVVNISGIASDYRSIALQADIFNSAKGRYFKNILFSNLTKDKNNNVSFNLKFNVDPELLSYEKSNLAESSTPSNDSVDTKITNDTQKTTTQSTEEVKTVNTNPLPEKLDNNIQ